ncbi:RagB/SusD family nutrient uptake outer membrane protein [Flavobacterium selenitireducens]|uniref:RagB/SusD family nutrient uptake outer membrane protein n=1 Tax=Flavobacterium selenitireducens TaxID=2722704 RepID=UPI00168BC720|nr:RagB/SusD family nutrient uptake outer membrane protein [Flavobacterium selenitireducens]MBD3582903.1 RagB/SusD family nutrient uptake outer membrane protein [Flavobacterium selenitireducens]
MKRIKYLKLPAFALASVAIMTGCNDDEFLDKKPQGYATVGEYPAGGLEAQAFGLYGRLRTEAGLTDWTRYWFQSIRSDDAAKGSTQTDAANFGTIFDSYQYSAAENFAAGNWNSHYRLIYDCNDIIVTVDEMEDPDDNTLANKAEATCMRAFSYFDLRRDYGEVPIVLNRVTTPSEGIAPKSTVAEVDAQIIADLQFAIEYLPVSWPNQLGRATKGFAHTLLGKLYLYQQNYAQSLEQLQIVMGMGYSLYPSYADLFLGAGDNSAESIFEIQFYRSPTNQNYSNNYWESQGVRGAGSWDLGWGFNVPTQVLVDAYEAGDPRRAATILFSGQSDNMVPALVVPESPPLAQPYWNRKAYTKAIERSQFGENKNHWANIKLFRYADVLLMAAEAANEQGQTGVAVGYINEVRARARGGNNAVLPDIMSSDQSVVRTAIKHERRIEFAMEGERFYDLVRWGDAPSVLGGLGYQPKNRYYPIPQTAIDQFGGVLVQNPDY